MIYLYVYLAVALYYFIDVAGSYKIRKYMRTLSGIRSKAVLVSIMIGTSLIWPVFLFGVRNK